MSARRDTRFVVLVIFLAVVAALAAACEAVPTLRFAAGLRAVGGGGEDGGSSDAEDASGPCASGQPPDGAAICCGQIPCEGDCAGKCSVCSMCPAGEICCAKNMNVVCKPADVGCH
jgi:hypothetical protein